MIERLERPRESSPFVAVTIRDGVDWLTAGVRILGEAQFKGIGHIKVYEVIDGQVWGEEDLEPCSGSDPKHKLRLKTLQSMLYGAYPTRTGPVLVSSYRKHIHRHLDDIGPGTRSRLRLRQPRRA